MCGVVGILGTRPVNQDIFDALTTIQHRGQDAAGMMTSEGKKIHLRKSNGLVRDAIRNKHIIKLRGNMGIGHVRYPTAGTDSVEESQPLYVNAPFGLGIAHNGNLINADALAQEVVSSNHRHLNTDSDSEILLNVFADELQKIATLDLEPKHIFYAIRKVHERCKGSYSAVILIANHGLVAFRDPNGIRPLAWGKSSDGGLMVASETVALDALGFQVEDDVLPGEAIYFTVDQKIHRQQCAVAPSYMPCIFESVYLSRPDSFIDGMPVYQFRYNLGEQLAEKILETMPEHDIDVVIPIPDTSRTAALPLAVRLGVAYREGFVKNRYIGRTFIMPGQNERRKSVKQKLNAIAPEFAGKNVLLVDDSVVRGTTSKEIIQMARDAGAKKVYFASSAPMIKYPNVYGIDMPAVEELIAHNRDVAKVCRLIGADQLIYQDLDGLYLAAKRANPKVERYEDSIFTGEYVTGYVDAAYLEAIAKARNDKAKQTLLDASLMLS